MLVKSLNLFMLSSIIAIVFVSLIPWVHALNLESESGMQANTEQADKLALYPFLHNDKWGYMDAKGNVVVKSQYDKASHFSDGLALVGIEYAQHRGWTDYRYGYIDANGKTAISVKYDYGTSFRNGNAVVCLLKDKGDDEEYVHYWIKPNGKYFLKLTDGDLGGEFSAEPFCDGLAIIEEADGDRAYFRYMDTKGNLVFDSGFWYAKPFSEGLAVVGKDYEDGYQFINTKGVKAIVQNFKYAGSFSDGLAPVSSGSKWGFIDKQGKYKIPPTYQDAYPFSEGLAAVKQNGKWGFIDKNNKFVITPQYKNVDDCVNGLIMVKDSKGKFLYYIDKNNKKIVPKI